MLEIRSALASCNQPDQYQHASPEAAVTIEEKPIQTLFQLAGWPDSFESKTKELAMAVDLPVPADYRTAAQSDDTTVFSVSPATWLCASSNDNLKTEVLNNLQPGELYVTDLSHARTRIRISGIDSTKLLQKVMSIDFSPEVFQANSFVQSCIHEMSVLVHQQPLASTETCNSQNRVFDLFVSRSYAVCMLKFLALSTAKPIC